MKTYLITGGYGFIGSCFVLKQINEGNKVINLDLLTYAANKDNLKEIESDANYRFIEGNICDEKLVSEIFQNNEIDSVIHFAAESHVDNSIKSPQNFIQTNIVGTYNLLDKALKYYEELKETKKKDFRFIHVSTDEVYGSLNEDDPKFSESTRYDPSSPYSSSKAASDHLAKAWYHTYGLPVIVTNCSNNYGERQHQEKLIPTIIRNCKNKTPIPIYGNGKNIRDWIYVEDHCNGINLALEKGDVGETYLFGGDCEKRNIEIAETICEIFNQKYEGNGFDYKDLISFVEDRKGHDFRYAIDNSKSERELGFKPSRNFKENLLKTIEFYL
jgi:dTDP-glucose 4,6-dehydratase